jgi:hypothetical protein
MNHRLKQWDIVVIFFAVFNSIFLPLELAFRPVFLESSWMMYINHCIDFCFFVDIIVTFNTSYIHPMTGEEVRNRKSIT